MVVNIKILFFYDYICPFCYLASNRIKALSSELGVEVEWIGIEIHPEYPSHGRKRKQTPKSTYLRHVLDSIISDHDSKIDLPGFVTNTRLCLEVSEYAKSRGRFSEFHDNVYNAYFNEGRNIGDINVIVDMAGCSGLDAEAVEKVIIGRNMKEKVQKNTAIAHENMVFGVPTVFVNGLRIHGAQTVDDYRKLIANELIRQSRDKKT